MQMELASSSENYATNNRSTCRHMREFDLHYPRSENLQSRTDFRICSNEARQPTFRNAIRGSQLSA
jgi:hypothetical protein